MKISVPRRKAGDVSADIRFTYTLDGILEVECKVQGEETASTLVIEKVPGQLSEEEIRERLRQLDGLKMHPGMCQKIVIYWQRLRVVTNSIWGSGDKLSITTPASLSSHLIARMCV
jgi:hypothetical protein